MFTAGQIVFALFFFISFIVIIFFSYKQDKKTINLFYRDSYKILFAFISGGDVIHEPYQDSFRISFAI